MKAQTEERKPTYPNQLAIGIKKVFFTEMKHNLIEPSKPK